MAPQVDPKTARGPRRPAPSKPPPKPPPPRPEHEDKGVKSRPGRNR